MPSTHLSFTHCKFVRKLADGKDLCGFRCSGLNLDDSFPASAILPESSAGPFALEPLNPSAEPLYLFMTHSAGSATAAFFCN